MRRFLDPKGLMCIALACYFLWSADAYFLVGCGVIFWIVFGLGGLLLCVLAGQISREERDEANGETKHQLDEAVGLNHPDNLEGKN